MEVAAAVDVADERVETLPFCSDSMFSPPGIVDDPVVIREVVPVRPWTALILEISDVSSFGRERASATTLVFPCR